jgi:ATP-dependent DNA helicase RecQ
LEDDATLDLQMPADTRTTKKNSSLPFTKDKPAKKKASPATNPDIELTPAAQQLEQALKAWRTEMARKLGMPPFVVLHDKTLRAIAHACPTTPNQLQEIPGMGPAKVDKYGPQILTICQSVIPVQ